MRLLDQTWFWRAFAVPVFFAAVYGVYVASDFSGPDIIQILIGGILGIVVSFPFALVLGFLAVLSGQVVLVIAKRGSRRFSSQQWRIAFSAATCVTIAAASAASLIRVNFTGLGLFTAVGVIGIIAFASAYLYFPEDELEALRI
ncbi:hypothetical protein G6027_09470 [Dietzia sp. SLG310A2-38A2]|uniref:hypothetical protein n=1 Tax=Dietzia sp. SLG310A2-38A2 TaxID=1630643 RepID=UPI0015FA84FC|nr:hypothetical protein [Dietzia sp. SLG310A2-38A2]MBB1031109.1 hypothetical protein [Dietzia sp. SLG310A2-38A2]